MTIRSDAHEAVAALQRAGELGHARAVKRLLASHATLTSQVSRNHDELIAARRRAERADYRQDAPYV